MPRATRSGSGLRRRVGRSALIVAGGLVISAASWSVFRYGVEGVGSGLPVLGTIPQFSLVSSSGEPLTAANLAGQVWIADFIFTQCPTLCPTLSNEMAKLQRRVSDDGSDAVRLVSFSVDPTHDTPEVLRAYGERLHADNKRWLFVTGDRAALFALISDGFRLAVAERPADQNDDGTGLITHSDRFVLVDRNLQIRGYYHGTDPDSLAHLVDDLKTLRAAS